MEQWIYARLYDKAVEIMENANEEFFFDVDFSGASEDDMCDVCCALNKLAYAIGKVIRNTDTLLP